MNGNILTLDNLIAFCKKNKMYSFNAIEQNNGNPIVVHVPNVAELVFDEHENYNEDGMIFPKLRVCHTLLNRNGSFISEENMKKAMPSLKYRPLLAYIHQLDDGTWDFHSHDLHTETDKDGNEFIVYDEQQIGCFTADEPYLEYDEEMDKTYVVAKGAIPEEYSRAADIIRSKNSFTKVSCELCIYSMKYNAKNKYLDLEDFRFNGCTCLGSEKDGTEIGEGMLGSKLTLEDFSVENNSLFSNNENLQQQLIEMSEKLNTLISHFDINENSKEGGNQVTNEEIKIEEEVTETVTEAEESTDEEVTEAATENETEDTADDTPDTVEEITDNSFDMDDSGDDSADDTSDDSVDDIDSEDNIDNSEEEPEEESAEPVAVGASNTDDSSSNSDDDEIKKKQNNSMNYARSINENGDMSVTFAISHEDTKYALYNLLAPYEDADNAFYYITAVYDDHFVYEDFWTGEPIYGQKYAISGDNVTLDGDRYSLHKEYLTDDELAELNSMRSNYAELKQFKEDTENAQLHLQREAILTDEKYAVISEKEIDSDGNEVYKNEAFGKLVSEMDNYSLEDLEKEVKSIFADHITAGGQFSLAEKKTVSKKLFGNADKKVKTSGRYGNLFAKDKE